MNTQKSRRLFGGTIAIAIAATSLLVSVPTFAKPQTAASPVPTPFAKPHTAASPKPITSGTIVEVATKAGFKTLVAAVKAAGLVDTLSGQGPFTVFAPTDAAFAKLPKGTLEKLLKPENKATLQKILTYHVVSGAIDSKSIKPGQVKTVEGSLVTVQVNKGRIKVGGARVTQADVKASNGVIHVINKVLLPPDVKL